MTALTWRKAKRCHANNTCTEVAKDGRTVLVRDSKNPAGPGLRFGTPEWRRFVEAVKAG